MAPPNDPAKCPGHPALEAKIEALNDRRVEDKKEIKEHVSLVMGNFEEKFDTVTDRIEKRLDRGDEKFAQQNGDIVHLKGRSWYIFGGLAVIMFLTPLVIALIALYK